MSKRDVGGSRGTSEQKTYQKAGVAQLIVMVYVGYLQCDPYRASPPSVAPRKIPRRIQGALSGKARGWQGKQIPHPSRNKKRIV